MSVVRRLLWHSWPSKSLRFLADMSLATDISRIPGPVSSAKVPHLAAEPGTEPGGSVGVVGMRCPCGVPAGA